MEKGTLFQLRNMLNRRNVSTSVKSNVNAYEDFFDVITRGHIVAAALEHLGMSSLNAQPDPTMVDPSIWMEDDAVRKEKLLKIASEIVDKYVDLSTEFSQLHSVKGTVYAYACETLSLCLLLKEFKDAIREGDGNRVMAVWQYLLLIFKSSGRKNYAIEAFTILAQYHFILPPQLAEQLKWSRFINNHGAPGKNICMDLHMEHLVRLCKTSIEGLGANKSERAIIRVGKTVGILDELLNSFDSENGISPVSDTHSARGMDKDLHLVIKELQEIRAFEVSSSKVHNSFKSLSTNLIRTLDEKKVKDWMVTHMTDLLYEC